MSGRRPAAFARDALTAIVGTLVLLLAAGCSEHGPPVEPVGVDPPRATPTAPGPTPSVPAVPPVPNTPRPGGIYVVGSGGSEPVLLAAGGAWPAWSPDGRRIAFDRDGAIHVVDVDGTHLTRLGEGLSPAWSPDGTRIAFGSRTGISVMDADGSGGATLVRHDFRDDTYEPWDLGVGKPAWSPDGARIAFEHLGDGDTQPAQIFVMNADGTNVRLLTAREDGRRCAESDPSWSPDGASVAFWSFCSGIAVIGVAGGPQRTVYLGFPIVAYGAKPVWSPDGTRIAFVSGGRT